MSERIEAQNLKCGMEFWFRQTRYVALSCFTDKRHTQTIVTCIPSRLLDTPLQLVIVIRFFRTFQVPLSGVLHPIEKQILEMSRDELETCSTALERE